MEASDGGNEGRKGGVPGRERGQAPGVSQAAEAGLAGGGTGDEGEVAWQRQRHCRAHESAAGSSGRGSRRVRASDRGGLGPGVIDACIEASCRMG